VRDLPQRSLEERLQRDKALLQVTTAIVSLITGLLSPDFDFSPSNLHTFFCCSG